MGLRVSLRVCLCVFVFVCVRVCACVRESLPGCVSVYDRLHLPAFNVCRYVGVSCVFVAVCMCVSICVLWCLMYVRVALCMFVCYVTFFFLFFFFVLPLMKLTTLIIAVKKHPKTTKKCY